MRPIVFFLVLVMLFPFSSHGKKTDRYYKATYCYNHYAYTDAIRHLEKLIATGSSSLEVQTMLGDCYRLTGNMDGAAKAYARATIVKKCSNITYLNYGLVLMKQMKYEEAEKNFRKYLEKNKNDPRALTLISSCNSAAAKLNDFPSGITHLAPFNTDAAEFAPTLWNGNLVFTSDADRDTWKERDKWSGGKYCGIYSVPMNGPGDYGDSVHLMYGPKKFTTEYHAGPCTFSDDGNEMYYTTSRYHRKFAARRATLVKDSTVVLQIMIASEYGKKAQAFNKIKPFQYNSDEYSVTHPALSPNGRVLVFSSDMPNGSGKRDLYLCKKEGEGWSEPVNLGTVVNTEGDEVFPWWPNDTTLFFSSDGHIGLGGLDTYKTLYNAGSSTFSKPEDLPFPINSPYDDVSMAMASNLSRGYLSSDRPGKKGRDNIYYYEKREVYLQLNVTDSTTQAPLESVTISLKSSKRKLDTISANGRLYARLFPEAIYSLRISKDGYPTKEFSINTTSTKEVDTIFKNVALFNPNVEKPHRKNDTLAAALTEQVVIRNRNVMDSPGIRDFNLNETYEVGDFSYAYNRYELTSAHKKFLDTLVAQLNRHKTMVIEIHAHTDCRGSDASNLKLSTQRALSVVNYLEAHGILRAKVQYKGLGNTDPKVKCPDCNSCTEEQHALNRIFEFKVLHL